MAVHEVRGQGSPRYARDDDLEGLVHGKERKQRGIIYDAMVSVACVKMFCEMG